MEYNAYRRKSREIKIGNIAIGGDNPVAIQSMTNTDSTDFDATYAQMKSLEAAGCDIIRMAVPNMESVAVLYKLKCSDISMPIVADIHFDHKLAIESAHAGADKIRINPGNIGDNEKIKAVADICRQKNIAIRVGVNSGSLEKAVLKEFGREAHAFCASAISNVRLLERCDFNKIVVAVKSSDVRTMVAANTEIAEMCDYPIHLGVTEAGTQNIGSMKSAAGIGSCLALGIGDTLRVSLTCDPLEEIKRGYEIASLFKSRKGVIDIISCPTCGRTKVDIISIAEEFEKRSAAIKTNKNIKVAIMGCAVNGPGEASEADIGIAGGDGEAVVFSKGKIIRKVPQEMVLDILLEETEKIARS